MAWKVWMFFALVGLSLIENGEAIRGGSPVNTSDTYFLARIVQDGSFVCYGAIYRPTVVIASRQACMIDAAAALNGSYGIESWQVSYEFYNVSSVIAQYEDFVLLNLTEPISMAEDVIEGVSLMENGALSKVRKLQCQVSSFGPSDKRGCREYEYGYGTSEMTRDFYHPGDTMDAYGLRLRAKQIHNCVNRNLASNPGDICIKFPIKMKRLCPAAEIGLPIVCRQTKDDGWQLMGFYTNLNISRRFMLLKSNGHWLSQIESQVGGPVGEFCSKHSQCNQNGKETFCWNKSSCKCRAIKCNVSPLTRFYREDTLNGSNNGWEVVTIGGHSLQFSNNRTWRGAGYGPSSRVDSHGGYVYFNVSKSNVDDLLSIFYKNLTVDLNATICFHFNYYLGGSNFNNDSATLGPIRVVLAGKGSSVRFFETTVFTEEWAGFTANIAAFPNRNIKNAFEIRLKSRGSDNADIAIDNVFLAYRSDNETCSELVNHYMKQRRRQRGLALELLRINTFRPYEGPVVAVTTNGVKGVVANFGIEDHTTEKTICKLLGHGDNALGVLRFTDIHNLPVVVTKNVCHGNETDIEQCDVTVATNPFYWQWAPGLHCFNPVITDVRLFGGSSHLEGAVQVLMDGRWGSVCSSPHGAPERDAFRAICRTLGFRTYDFRSGGFGSTATDYKRPAYQPSWLNLEYTRCFGNETKIQDCDIEPKVKFQPGCERDLIIKCTDESICLSADDCLEANTRCDRLRCVPQ